MAQQDEDVWLYLQHLPGDVLPADRTHHPKLVMEARFTVRLVPSGQVGNMATY